MVNYIAGGIIALIIIGCVYYIIRAKRSGKKCIGCPYANKCGGGCGCNVK